MDGKTTSPARGQETDAETDDRPRRWQYAHDAHGLRAPSTRETTVTDATAMSTTERLHGDLSVSTEATATLTHDYEPQVRMDIENDRVEEKLSLSLELDAADARALARSLEESARKAEEIVIEERTEALADR